MITLILILFTQYQIEPLEMSPQPDQDIVQIHKFKGLTDELCYESTQLPDSQGITENESESGQLDFQPDKDGYYPSGFFFNERQYAYINGEQFEDSLPDSGTQGKNIGNIEYNDSLYEYNRNINVAKRKAISNNIVLVEQTKESTNFYITKDQVAYFIVRHLNCPECYVAKRISKIEYLAIEVNQYLDQQKRRPDYEALTSLIKINKRTNFTALRCSYQKLVSPHYAWKLVVMRGWNNPLKTFDQIKHIYPQIPEWQLRLQPWMLRYKRIDIPRALKLGPTIDPIPNWVVRYYRASMRWILAGKKRLGGLTWGEYLARHKRLPGDRSIIDMINNFELRGDSLPRSDIDPCDPDTGKKTVKVFSKFTPCAKLLYDNEVQANINETNQVNKMVDRWLR